MIPAWMEDGLCRQTDPELFFPEKGGNAVPAVRICRRCPVIGECLDYAVTHCHETHYGVWGGATERYRRKLRHGKAAA